MKAYTIRFTENRLADWQQLRKLYPQLGEFNARSLDKLFAIVIAQQEQDK